MKELSKQICEICKVQTPGKLIFHKRNWDDKCYISAGRGYKEFDFKSCPNVTVDILPENQWEEKMGWQYPYKRIEEIKKLYDKNGYDFVEFKTETIDFKNTANFVKLVNIIYKCGINQPYDYQLATLSFDEDNYIEVEQHERFEDRYLEVLLYSLGKSYDTWDKTFSNKVKQMIREAEWKYE